MERDDDSDTETMRLVCERVYSIAGVQAETISEETCSLIEVQFNVRNIQYRIKAIKRCTDSPEDIAEVVKQLILNTLNNGKA